MVAQGGTIVISSYVNAAQNMGILMANTGGNETPNTQGGSNPQYKKSLSGSGKEKATDVPSWAKGNKPYVDESGKDFAKRLCDERYGPGNYETGPTSDFNKIKKWGDRAFK